jgi:anaerobic magnesium-protoporphyrin IX monomethyl ester cyclase
MQEDEVLRELLLWDYSHFSLVTRKTPDWIAGRLRESVAIAVAGSRRRLPVLEFCERAAAWINRRRLQPLAPGRYAVWPRQHKKGTPVEIIPIGRTES